MKKIFIISLIIFLSVTVVSCGRRRAAALATAQANQPEQGEPLPGNVGVILFQDDFQDGQPDGWKTTGAWYVNQQGDIYNFGAIGQGAALLLTGSDWGDYILRATARVNTGTLAINFRLTRNGRYILTLREDGVYLSKEIAGTAPVSLGRFAAPSLNTWHNVVIGCERGRILVYIDRVLVLDYTDPAPLLQGTIGVGTPDNSQASVDDVLVVKLLGSLPAISAPPAVISGGQAPQSVGPALVDAPPSGGPGEQEQPAEEERPPEDIAPENNEDLGTPPVSDLVVTNVTVSNLTPNINEWVTVSATILNQGPDPAQNFQWVIIPTYDSGGPNNPAGGEVVSLLNSGDDMFVEARVIYPNAGTYTVRVIDDVIGNINDPSPGEYMERQVEVGSGGHFEAPPAPLSCVATATSDSVTLIWFFALEPVREGFHIYQAITSLEGTAGAEDTRFTVGNLQPNVQYHFDVRAFNSAGESAADACFVDITTIP